MSTVIQTVGSARRGHFRSEEGEKGERESGAMALVLFGEPVGGRTGWGDTSIRI